MSNDPTDQGLLTRRELIAVLASVAALPLLSACAPARTSAATAAIPATDADRSAMLLLERIGNDLLNFFPERATSLGLDVGARAELRSRLADRSAAGQRRLAEQRRADAIAHEQEMKAQVAANRAGVVLAEAEVPRAMAEAFRQGHLLSSGANNNGPRSASWKASWPS